jgi:GPH family glycoside/pentoside/hexuronide:cation symporter
MAQSLPLPQPARFDRSYTLIWGLAEFGKSLINGTFGALLPIFYQDYLGLEAGWFALAAPIYAIWNAINDPLFGYMTDSTRSKRGRRIPYLRFTAPFLGLTFILVWFAPPGAGQQTIFWWMLGTMLLFDTCYTIIGLVYSALLPEVTESDRERHKLQVSASVLGLVGTLLGFIIPNLFRPGAGGTASFGPLQAAMILIAAVGVAFLLLFSFRVKERPEFTQVDKPLPLGPAIRYTLRNRSFLALVSANFMSILMNALLLGAMFYLADYVLQADTMLPLAAVFVPLLIGVPITQLAARRFGIVASQQLFFVIAGIALILLTFAPVALILPCLAVAGFGLAGPQTLTNLLFAQVADEDELRSGVRREGAFFGINALITKPAQSIALALQPAILQLGGFITRESNSGQIFLDQPAAALFGIRALIGLIPGIAMLLAAVLLIWYPLRGLRLKKQQSDVLALHAAKHAALQAQSRAGSAIIVEHP